MRFCKLIVERAVETGAFQVPITGLLEDIPNGQLANIAGNVADGTVVLQNEITGESEYLAVSPLVVPIDDLNSIVFPQGIILVAENGLALDTEVSILLFSPADNESPTIPSGSIGIYRQVTGGIRVECAWTPNGSPALQLIEPLSISVAAGTEIWYQKLDFIPPFEFVVPIELGFLVGAEIASLNYQTGSTGEYPISIELELGYLTLEEVIISLPEVILEIGAEISSLARPFTWPELNIETLLAISVADYKLLQ